MNSSFVQNSVALFSSVGMVVSAGCASSQLQIVDVYMKQQDWNRARTKLEEITTEYPQNGEAFLMLAEVYAELGEMRWMMEALNQAVESSEGNRSEANFIREKYWIGNLKHGNMHFEESNYNESLLYFHRVVQIDSSNIIGLKGFAASLYMTGHPEQAEQVFRKILVLEPGNTTIANNLAEICFIKKRFSESLAFCNQALEGNKSDVQALARRAHIYSAQGLLNLAEKDLLLAAKLQPTEEMLTDCGVILYRNKKYEEAVDYFTSALELSGSRFQLFRHLGQANNRLKNYTEMAKWFKKMVDINGTNLYAWQNLAVAYEALGNRGELAHARHLIEELSGSN